MICMQNGHLKVQIIQRICKGSLTTGGGDYKIRRGDHKIMDTFYGGITKFWVPFTEGITKSILGMV